MSKPLADEKKSPSSKVVAAFTENDKRDGKNLNFMENMRRSFRSFPSSLLIAAKGAEKLASKPKTVEEEKRAQEELIHGVTSALKYRQNVREQTASLEGKLRGNNAKELQALHCMLRSQPCVGGRKRKFSIANDEIENNKKIQQSKSEH